MPDTQCPRCGRNVSMEADTYRRLIDTVAEHRQRPRPIETAPRDGTAILARCPTIYRGAGGWLLLLWTEGAWAFPGGTYRNMQPTLWLPTPERPDVQ